MVSGSAAALILPVVASLVSACLVSTCGFEEASIDYSDTWRRFVEAAMKRPEGSSHEAAAKIIGAASRQFDCINNIKR